MSRWLRNIWLHYTIMGCFGRTVVWALVVMVGLVSMCTGVALVADHTTWLDEVSEDLAENVRKAQEADATARAGEGSTAPRVLVGSEINLDELSEEDRARLLRWREASEHWEFIDAFTETMFAVNEDYVIDLQESRDLCYKAPQWGEQMTAVREYVAAYREIEPETVAETPRIYNLETEADRALEIVEELEKECQ